MRIATRKGLKLNFASRSPASEANATTQNNPAGLRRVLDLVFSPLLVLISLRIRAKENVFGDSWQVSGFIFAIEDLQSAL